MFSKTKKRIQSTFLKVFSSFLISYILFTSPIYYKKTLKPASDMHLNSSLRLDDVKPIERLNLNTKPLERKIYMDFLHHRILSEKKSVSFMQITVNQEGKVMGCKPYKIRYVNYWSAEQSNQLLKKTQLLINFDNKLTLCSLKFILE